VANTEKTEKIFARKSSTDHYRALHRTSESRKCNNQTRVLFAFAHRAENILEQRINPKNRLSALSNYKRHGRVAETRRRYYKRTWYKQATKRNRLDERLSMKPATRAKARRHTSKSGHRPCRIRVSITVPLLPTSRKRTRAQSRRSIR